MREWGNRNTNDDNIIYIYTSKRMMSVPWLYINKEELALAHIKPIKFKHVENLPNQAHDAYFKP